jgi:hypothetical protein
MISVNESKTAYIYQYTFFLILLFRLGLTYVVKTK